MAGAIFFSVLQQYEPDDIADVHSIHAGKQSIPAPEGDPDYPFRAAFDERREGMKK